MRITICAIGTRGDVQPLVALGAGLLKRGHGVRLVAGDEYAPLAERAGLTRLFDYPMDVIATSLPFLTANPVPLKALNNEHFTIGRYYRPLRTLPMTANIYSRILNVPSHPDMQSVETDTILDVLGTIGEKGS